MKARKSGLICSIIFCVLFLAIGVYMLAPLFEKSPIVISEKITISHVEGMDYVWGGKIKNNTNSTIVLKEDDFSISTHTADEQQNQYGPLVHSFGWFANLPNGELVLKAGEEYDLSNEGQFSCGERKPDKVVEVKAVIDGKTYYLLGGVSTSQIVVCSVAFSLAVIVILAGVLGYVYEKKRVARFNELADYARSLNGENITVSGFYGNPKMNGSAILKSIGSALFGMFCAVFTGFGFYKIYRGKAKQYFIITDKGIYINNPKNKEIDLDKMRFHEKSKFINASVSPIKGAVVLTANGEDYIFSTKASGIEQQTILDALEKMTKEENF